MNDEEITTMRFTPQESSVVSVRLNRAESRALTDAARFHGVKLSTYIKRAAMSEATRPQVRYSEEPA